MEKVIRLEPGAYVYTNGEEHIITHILDMDSVLTKNTKTGESTRLRIAELGSKPPPLKSENEKSPIDPRKKFIDPNAVTIPDKDWQEANRRYKLIYPLLTAKKRTTAMVKEVAQNAEVHPVTIYRWIKEYERTGWVSSLIPTDKNGGRGKTRLAPEIEEIVTTTIESYFLQMQRRSISGTIREIERLCYNAGLTAPHGNTIRNRIASISDREKISKRHGAKATEQRFSPVVQHFPGADYPLSAVQIDHTQLDIIVVDEVSRMSIDRPWITVAIDVYSRMILGFYIGLEYPSAMSVGICLSNAISTKEKLLNTMQIDLPWKCWGLPAMVHADNAKEFRGEMITKVCQQYGIDLVWRPVKKPRFGSHVERLMGTFANELHDLPGTTFSNIQERGDYDSEKHASFTLPELEKWLTLYILGVYHQKPRDVLNKMSPAKKYMEGLRGDSKKKGLGLPPKLSDEEKLRFDFMPHFERTIQRTYGVEIELITYYSPILNEFIGVQEPYKSAKGRNISSNYIFKRDPRNIAEIYFYHPEDHEYHTIPYRDITHPPISIWEVREIRRRLEDAGRNDIDEQLIFQTYNDMRHLEEKTVKETKAARRKRQKRTYHSNVSYKTNSDLINRADDVSKESKLKTEDEFSFPTHLKPFDDTERL